MEGTPKVTRRDLYFAYRHELLVDIAGHKEPEPEHETLSWLDLLTQEDGVYKWFDILSEDEPVGFFAICISPAAIRGADYAIVSAYIMPSSRHRGLMSRAIEKYVIAHPGIWVWTVKTANINARRFWPRLFDRIGYEPADLAVPFGFLSDDEQLVSYKPKG